MQKSLYISFFLLFTNMVSEAQINAELSAGMEIFDSGSNYSAGRIWSIHPTYNTDENSVLGLLFKVSDSEILIITPAQNLQPPVHITALMLTYTYFINSGIYNIRIGPGIALGYKWLKREAYKINLGTLGPRMIASVRENYPALNTGLKISLPLSKLSDLIISSSLAYNNLNNGFWSVTFSGGLNVAIL
ncbi:MAG: hypothetical protein H6627_02695 [Calditrichae bacterium]|nr:hypothetical protein [Calditrichota bacterium]MCB9057443.1 hypothetical protein [Calditrichia bacterium]